jgi:hypothetical protein
MTSHSIIGGTIPFMTCNMLFHAEEWFDPVIIDK